MSEFLPSNEERKEVQQYIEKFDSELSNLYGNTTKRRFVGSTVVGTFVSGSHDIDVDVLSEDYMKAFNLAKKQFPNGKEKKSGTLLIWDFKKDGYDIELVFGKENEIDTNAIAHTDLYKNSLTDKQKDDVVKLKAFLKTYGLYGAEVGGFTGVALEELVRIRGNADEVIVYLKKMNNKPFLQDPVLKTSRDLLASVMPEKWEAMKGCLRGYPHFRYNLYTDKEFLAKNKDFSILEFSRVHDAHVDYSTALSLIKTTRNELLSQDKEIREFDYDVFVDPEKIIIAWKVEPQVYLSETTVKSMSKQFPEGVEQFKKAHEGFWEDKDNVYARVKRKIQSPQVFVLNTLTDKMKKRNYEFYHEGKSTLCETKVRKKDKIPRGINYV